MNISTNHKSGIRYLNLSKSIELVFLIPNHPLTFSEDFMVSILSWFTFLLELRSAGRLGQGPGLASASKQAQARDLSLGLLILGSGVRLWAVGPEAEDVRVQPRRG